MRDWMGHADIGTTNRYLSGGDVHSQEAMKKTEDWERAREAAEIAAVKEAPRAQTH